MLLQMFFLFLGSCAKVNLGEKISRWSPSEGSRIVGGTNADIEDYPYQLSFQTYGRHLCGASIVSSRHVLTAAHCVEGASPDPISLRAGSSYYDQGGQLVKVKKWAIHPNYDSKTVDYDVAILHLRSWLRLGHTVGCVKQPPQGLEFTEESGTVTGWGVLDEGDDVVSRRLQQVRIPIVDHEVCKARLSVTDRMFCAGYPEGGKDSCQGDSGGPFVIQGMQVGIVSWGAGCARPGLPGVYTKTSNREISAFIAEETQKRTLIDWLFGC